MKNIHFSQKEGNIRALSFLQSKDWNKYKLLKIRWLAQMCQIQNKLRIAIMVIDKSCAGDK